MRALSTASGQTQSSSQKDMKNRSHYFCKTFNVCMYNQHQKILFFHRLIKCMYVLLQKTPMCPVGERELGTKNNYYLTEAIF